MTPPEPKLILALPGNRNLSLPVKTALWKFWCIATYPLAIAFGYYLFGWVGIVWVLGMQVLNFRGRL